MGEVVKFLLKSLIIVVSIPVAMLFNYFAVMFILDNYKKRKRLTCKCKCGECACCRSGSKKKVKKEEEAI